MDELSRNISILLNVNKKYIPKAEYVFRTFCKILGLQPNFYYEYTPQDIHVYYGPPAEDRRPVEIYYNEQAALLFNKQSRYEGDIHFFNYRNENIPFLFSEKGELFLFTPQSLEVRKDIVASAFYFLSCWREYITERNAAAEKYTLDSTFQRAWDFEDIPVVDRYCDIFQKALETMLPGYQKQKKWFQNKDFAVSVSQLVSNYASHSGRSTKSKEENRVNNGNLNFELIAPSRFLKKIKSVTNLLDTQEFLLPQYTVSDKKNHEVKALDPHISLIQTVLSNKVIGICSKGQISSRKLKESIINYAERGFIIQGHYLCFLKKHYTGLFEKLEETEVKYDLSIGYSDSLGYRAGISYPYYPFNIEENKPFNTLEIPQVVDNMVFDHIPHTKRYIKNHIEYLINDAYKFKTHFGIVWNHSKLSDIKYQSFDKLLKKLRKRNAWLCSPHDIYNHWINR